MVGDILTWSEDLPILLDKCEQADKGHLRGILHRWYHAASRSHLFGAPLLTALVIYGEARGEGDPGPTAVFQVIANRAQKITPHDLDAVLLRPYQFSCLNRGDSSLNLAEGESCTTIAFWLKRVRQFITLYQSGVRLPGLDKVTIYAPPDVVGEQYCRWLVGDKHAWNFDHLKFCQTIGNHSFFEEV